MVRGIQISDAARARREGPATKLAEMRLIVGMNSSFFTWHVNPAGLSRWGKWGIAPGNLPMYCNLKDLVVEFSGYQALFAVAAIVSEYVGFGAFVNDEEPWPH
jgi:hypothetical protein